MTDDSGGGDSLSSQQHEVVGRWESDRGSKQFQPFTRSFTTETRVLGPS